ncbi:NAD(P)/FAD-dependent oxidoreductase [Galbibacter pacificus]|uniref:NAD(P)/FAD-dependent oxidoreductase n=1 Tax=Galbibacter pacificus TaxID=2996052 RepID=A0ABT6FNF6_9FLAO|nr:NAD(P)/FAD-dependent oxidoreductase [Galbibacter pacificus]MDG3581229.1 NAD(P)/FAD-dependent oxidoreductase [Galbibacter pacificus]MDG3584707.1 NAD(P)/FAD-dependent oxidoreductase [Galbibacter pacificus]
MNHLEKYAVIIIGGSYAGLSAAMSLGRSLQKTLIIDNGRPCNIQTPHSHNFLTQDGKAPNEITALAKEQVLNYPTVTFYKGKALQGKRIKDGFEIGTGIGDKFQAKKLIFATGIKDEMPNIKGFKACWGKTVIHCPYCHGYEHKAQPTGILANGPGAVHLAGLVRNLTGSVTIFTNGKADFTGEALQKLSKRGIPIVETEVKALEHTDGILENVVLADRTKVSLKALYAKVPFVQHSDIPESLGCEITEHGYIQIDQMQKTSVANIYACGDNSTGMRSVANAVYTGNLTGAMVNMELVGEKFDR